MIWNSFRIEDLPIVISPSGLLDARHYSQAISWSAITDISKSNVYSAKFVRLDIDPDQITNLKPTLFGKIMAWLAKTLGPQNTFHLSNGDLDVKFDELYEIISAYLKVHNTGVGRDI